MSEISVREWQARFRAGEFSSRDRDTQCRAGWYDWFCRSESLAGRLKKLSSVVLGIKAAFILDNYYVWFKNNCPMSGPLYDDARFEPLAGERDGKYFVVSLDSPHEPARWVLYTERYGYDAPEFCCGNAREIARYIDAIAPELESGSLPGFVQEKEAVARYVLRHEGKAASCIRREGEHLFTYQSSVDWKYRAVAASTSLEKTSKGYPTGQAEQYAGIYVFPSEAPAQSKEQDAIQQSQHRKGQER